MVQTSDKLKAADSIESSELGVVDGEALGVLVGADEGEALEDSLLGHVGGEAYGELDGDPLKVLKMSQRTPSSKARTKDSTLTSFEKDCVAAAACQIGRRGRIRLTRAAWAKPKGRRRLQRGGGR